MLVSVRERAPVETEVNVFSPRGFIAFDKEIHEKNPEKIKKLNIETK